MKFYEERMIQPQQDLLFPLDIRRLFLSDDVSFLQHFDCKTFCHKWTAHHITRCTERQSQPIWGKMKLLKADTNSAPKWHKFLNRCVGRFFLKRWQMNGLADINRSLHISEPDSLMIQCFTGKFHLKISSIKAQKQLQFHALAI